MSTRRAGRLPDATGRKNRRVAAVGTLGPLTVFKTVYFEVQSGDWN
jgi:hypothetical protein